MCMVQERQLSLWRIKATNEVSDEGGTERLAMQVIEGCDSAKDFSIKAPQCAHRSSE